VRITSSMQPQHERRKYLRLVPEPVVFRFAGLGRRGESVRQRARALADAGFGAATGALVHGFLEQQGIRGHPLESASAVVALGRLAKYLAWLRRSFVIDETDCIQALHETTMTNACDGF